MRKKSPGLKIGIGLEKLTRSTVSTNNTNNDDPISPVARTPVVRAKTPMQRKRNVTVDNRRNSTMSITDKTSVDLDPHTTVLKDWALQTIKLGIAGLVKEFAELKLETAGAPRIKTAFDANPDKNRYKDVFCQDESRVILKGTGSNNNDYIHANWVAVQGENRFICSQGPTEKTVDDFWRMVWENKCRAIVMLCNIFEQGRKKCEQYYPAKPNDAPLETSSGIIIRNIASTDVEKMLTVSVLEMTVDGETFSVRHYFWNSWPDRGVPSNIMACLRLLARIKAFSPVVVHCSAGIGRTGTIVGLEMCQQTILSGEPLSMFSIVKKLRSYRHGAVQTDIQYVYMHRVMMGLAENKKVVSQEKLVPFYESYDAFLKSRGC